MVNPSTARIPLNRDGVAMVTTLLAILVLTVIALAATWLATSEKRSSFAGGVYLSALYSADSGTEAGINYLRLEEEPPPIIDFGDMTVRAENLTEIGETQSYDYRCNYLDKQPKPGWGIEFLDYRYGLRSMGEASGDGRSAVRVVAGRLFREGY
jgi:hypothetical protein